MGGLFLMSEVLFYGERVSALNVVTNVPPALREGSNCLVRLT